MIFLGNNKLSNQFNLQNKTIDNCDELVKAEEVKVVPALELADNEILKHDSPIFKKLNWNRKNNYWLHIYEYKSRNWKSESKLGIEVGIDVGMEVEIEVGIEVRIEVWIEVGTES